MLWPSRDTAAVPALVRHGFAPLVVTAALTASLTVSRLRGRFDGPPPAVHIRRATAGDLHTVARFQAEIIRYDSQFGEITHRPSTVDAAERDAAKQLAAEKPWIWLAERDGEPVGLLAVAPPADAEWIAGHTSAGPVGYLSSLYVTPKSRGRGVGRALADTGHRALREAGAEVVLLHHALPNPRSTPFWYATGYRPLWTAWYRRPVFRKTPAA
ncbi:MAG: GNAT family N-acetyltransferase [Sciscionella sp.]|nr:GNAT family N-acetyltransferase [Sciscionella sp.]